MNKIILIIIVVVVVAGAVYFFSPEQTNNVSSGNVTIANFAFSPAVLDISKGDTVVWTNQDSAPHKIKSDTFNSAVMNKGESFQFTFSTAGEYNYSCSIHPSMKGKVIVTK